MIFGSSNDLEKILVLLDIKSENIGILFRILSATKEKDLLNGILLFLNKTQLSKWLKTYNLFLAFYSFFKGFDYSTFMPVQTSQVIKHIKKKEE